MSYRPLLSLPTPSLFGLTFAQKAKLLEHTGFQGIELFMFPSVARELEKHRLVAEHHGLRLSLHQPWSYGESGGHFSNRILGPIGYLPKDGYTLSDLVAHGRGELFIAYCDRRSEIATMKNPPVQFAYQTACSWIGAGKNRTHRIPYRELLDNILPTGAPIVFDTFHVLEWRLGKPGGKALGAYSEHELAKELLSAWNEIGQERIVEIHWNDFQSDERGSDGRNCFPGEGKLASGLRLLSREITRKKWEGYIVSELSPFLLFPYRTRTLIALRERMEQFFV